MEINVFKSLSKRLIRQGWIFCWVGWWPSILYGQLWFLWDLTGKKQAFIKTLSITSFSSSLALSSTQLLNCWFNTACLLDIASIYHFDLYSFILGNRCLILRNVFFLFFKKWSFRVGTILSLKRLQCINAIKGIFHCTALGTSQVTRLPGPGPQMVKVKCARPLASLAAFHRLILCFPSDSGCSLLKLRPEI